MHEILIRTQLCTLHNPKPTFDELYRIREAALMDLDYELLAEKYGTLIIRPSGSYMLLKGNEIVEEKFDDDFPIDEFGDIVICENDEHAPNEWVQYLKQTFPNQKIVTINYFDLRSENEIGQYFFRASVITFSTTFSSFGWFEKLTKLALPHHGIIGHCIDNKKWVEASKINPNVEII